MGTQNVQKSTSRPTLGIIFMPDSLVGSKLSENLKINRNRPENFPGSAAEAKPIELIGRSGWQSVAHILKLLLRWSWARHHPSLHGTEGGIFERSVP